MQNISIRIKLDLLIPFIFAGIALLSNIVCYQLTNYAAKHGSHSDWPVIVWVVCVTVIVFFCGLFFTKLLLRPAENFLMEAERLGVVSQIPSQKAVAREDEIGTFTSAFAQVTELLSKIEAKEMFPDIVGHSAEIRGVLSLIVKIAPSDSTVLIFGESGTGKEMVARSLHRHSRRCQGPFVAINCAAIPETLLESELFGHEKGAFTGASMRKIGKFELAEGGTLFLDEIGDMPLETQAKLLRVLESGEIRRVGGQTTLKVDVRIISATHKNLHEEVTQGRFREDNIMH